MLVCSLLHRFVFWPYIIYDISISLCVCVLDMPIILQGYSGDPWVKLLENRGKQGREKVGDCRTLGGYQEESGKRPGGKLILNEGGG